MTIGMPTCLTTNRSRVAWAILCSRATFIDHASRSPAPAVIRSLFFNKSSQSLITVSVYREDNFSCLKCRNTPLEYIRRGQPDQGFPIFVSECLRWPGFVEFDDVNAKVLTYTAQESVYRVWGMRNYELLYSLPATDVTEVKISPGAPDADLWVGWGTAGRTCGHMHMRAVESLGLRHRRLRLNLVGLRPVRTSMLHVCDTGIMLMIHARQGGFVPLQIRQMDDGRVLKRFNQPLHRTKKIDFIEQFNEKLLVKQVRIASRAPHHRHARALAPHTRALAPHAAPHAHHHVTCTCTCCTCVRGMHRRARTCRSSTCTPGQSSASRRLSSSRRRLSSSCMRTICSSRSGGSEPNHPRPSALASRLTLRRPPSAISLLPSCCAPTFSGRSGRHVTVWNFRGEVVTTFEDHTLWHADTNTNNIFITAAQDYIISYCRPNDGDLRAPPGRGMVHVSHILTGKCVSRLAGKVRSRTRLGGSGGTRNRVVAEEATDGGDDGSDGESASDEDEAGRGLGEVTSIYFSEERNELYVGNRQGILQVWSQ